MLAWLSHGACLLTIAPALHLAVCAAGVRKEVRAEGKTVMLFWYRNQIYAIEARSPAEGAYSEGFIKAKFTQDFCIGAWLVWVAGWQGCTAGWAECVAVAWLDIGPSFDARCTLQLPVPSS